MVEKVDEKYGEWLEQLAQRAVEASEDALKTIFKRIPDVDKSGVLDPRVLQNYKSMPPFGAAFESKEGEASATEFPIDKIREMMGWPNVDLSTGVSTMERNIPGSEASIPVRIYTPSGDGLKPAVVFFHGGGFIGGTLKAVENPCKGLSEKAGAVVISVDYRLAPENAYPAGLTDCWDIIQWVYNHAEEIGVDRSWIAVSGDSAGGNLSAVCSIIDQEKGTGYIKYQALIYPTVCMASENPYYAWSKDPYEMNEEVEIMNQVTLALAPKGDNMLRKLYIQEKESTEHPHLSPILKEDLSKLPTALVVTAEYDALRIEGKAYAKRLAEAGVDTTYICYQGMDHAFMDKYGIYPQAEDLMNEIAKGYRAVIAKG